MKQTKTRMRLCTALLVLNVLFIWGNSLLPSQISGAISGWVRDVLSAILGGGDGQAPIISGDGVLRKIAHFIEFACLGAGFGWLLAMLKKPVAYSLLCGFTVACVDETIQCFVPGRGPRITDVLLDTAGVACGLGLLLLGCAIYQKNKK